MTAEHSPVLEFPAMLHGSTATILRKVRAEGQWWAREYLQTGVFAQPRRMRQVAPGEVLVMHAGAELGTPHSCWRMHLLGEVIVGLIEGVPEEARPRMEEAFEAFEAFSLSTPWGALYLVVPPSPQESAGQVANRLASLLRFWDLLQGLRYKFWSFEQACTLEELMEDIYRESMGVWCPGGPASVRERMALMMERMARATREECLEAVLRVMPAVVETDPALKHCERLRDPAFLRERLHALPPEKFESLSSADKYAVCGLLFEWYRQLGRH
ncbi:MAG TPA: hypothetical protein VEY88_26225 [Archangium sp.]|nr:hypothetical protein [Archangium sp.]